MMYLQKKFDWDNAVTASISWDSLKQAIRRIGRITLTTKICNDMLPTGKFLTRINSKDATTCPLCGADETLEHILQCKHPNRIKWKQQTISKIRQLMLRANTDDALIDTFNSAITDWLDHGQVTHSKYPESHQVALYSQWKIGWGHVFTGHLSQDWEMLQGDTQIGKTIHKATDWAANLVTLILQQVITLWETRNEELHGKTKAEQTMKLLVSQKHTIAKLIELKPKCLARDHFLFPNKQDTLLNESSTTKLANWITSRTKAIHNSIQQALKNDIQYTNPVTYWFKPRETTRESTNLGPELQWHRNRLLHDPFNKKKRHKQSNNPTDPQTTTTYQTKLSKYFK